MTARTDKAERTEKGQTEKHDRHLNYTFQSTCVEECSKKDKSFKFKIPQPDSDQRHSPDFRTVFGIMIGPFSFCKIGKT